MSPFFTVVSSAPTPINNPLCPTFFYLFFVCLSSPTCIACERLHIYLLTLTSLLRIILHLFCLSLGLLMTLWQFNLKSSLGLLIASLGIHHPNYLYYPHRHVLVTHHNNMVITYYCSRWARLAGRYQLLHCINVSTALKPVLYGYHQY
jgi:hypothetical protein